MTGVFQEIVEPEPLVFTSSPLDKNGDPLFEVLNTVTFDGLLLVFVAYGRWRTASHRAAVNA
jgi:hypothetical protein